MLNEIQNPSLSNRKKLELSRLKASKWAEKQMLLSAKKKNKKNHDETNKENDTIGNFGITDNKVLSNKERLALSRAKANKWAQAHFMDSTIESEEEDDFMDSAIEPEEEDDEVASGIVGERATERRRIGEENLIAAEKKLKIEQLAKIYAEKQTKTLEDKLFAAQNAEAERLASAKAEEEKCIAHEEAKVKQATKEKAEARIAEEKRVSEKEAKTKQTAKEKAEKEAESAATGDATRNSFALIFVFTSIIVLSISLLIIVLKENETLQEHFPTPLLKVLSLIEEFATNLMTSVFSESHKVGSK